MLRGTLYRSAFLIAAAAVVACTSTSVNIDDSNDNDLLKERHPPAPVTEKSERTIFERTAVRIQQAQAPYWVTMGTGVIIHSSKKHGTYILTNWHVVMREQTEPPYYVQNAVYDVTLYNGIKIEASLIAAMHGKIAEDGTITHHDWVNEKEKKASPPPEDWDPDDVSPAPVNYEHTGTIDVALLWSPHLSLIPEFDTIEGYHLSDLEDDDEIKVASFAPMDNSYLALGEIVKGDGEWYMNGLVTFPPTIQGNSGSGIYYEGKLAGLIYAVSAAYGSPVPLKLRDDTFGESKMIVGYYVSMKYIVLFLEEVGYFWTLTQDTEDDPELTPHSLSDPWNGDTD